MVGLGIVNCGDDGSHELSKIGFLRCGDQLQVGGDREIVTGDEESEGGEEAAKQSGARAGVVWGLIEDRLEQQVEARE
ncbi:hypothetical protein M0R45_017339 [Rubus argutus]|uniref:Uncharacterized protein n=1 Tax=Rubus argutus TaxID=59490 RepID=A0AAW1XV89_RUBAR